MWAPNLTHSWPRDSRGEIAISAAFIGNYGYCSGVSWLVMGVAVCLGGEIRSGRSGRYALACGVHGITVEPRRDIR